MTFEYKMEEPNITESLEELQNLLIVLEENHKVESAKDESNQDYISDLETQIAAKELSMKLLEELTIEVFFGRSTIYRIQNRLRRS